jgi:hypothetical protein
MPTNPASKGRAITDSDLEATAREAMAACDGDSRATVKVLLVTVDHLQRELAAQEAEVARLVLDVSRDYSRGRWESLLERAEEPIPYTPKD